MAAKKAAKRKYAVIYQEWDGADYRVFVSFSTPREAAIAADAMREDRGPEGDPPNVFVARFPASKRVQKWAVFLDPGTDKPWEVVSFHDTEAKAAAAAMRAQDAAGGYDTPALFFIAKVTRV